MRVQVGLQYHRRGKRVDGTSALLARDASGQASSSGILSAHGFIPHHDGDLRQAFQGLREAGSASPSTVGQALLVKGLTDDDECHVLLPRGFGCLRGIRTPGDMLNNGQRPRDGPGGIGNSEADALLAVVNSQYAHQPAPLRLRDTDTYHLLRCTQLPTPTRAVWASYFRISITDVSVSDFVMATVSELDPLVNVMMAPIPAPALNVEAQPSAFSLSI